VIGMGIALRRASVKTALLGFAIVVALVIMAATPALLRSHKVVAASGAPRD
jgi:hypothetical protein